MRHRDSSHPFCNGSQLPVVLVYFNKNFADVLLLFFNFFSNRSLEGKKRAKSISFSSILLFKNYSSLL